MALVVLLRGIDVGGHRTFQPARLAEELGYHAVWFGEHHYSGYSFGAPPVIAMAAASRTKRIKVGTGVSLIPLNHPLRLAEEYAMLDVLSEGRLEYGIGRGFLNYSYQLFGINPDESHARYREGTDLIVKAWTSDGPFSFAGDFWQLADYSFFPKPLQKPHPPLWVAAVGEEATRQAARLGYNLMGAGSEHGQKVYDEAFTNNNIYVGSAFSMVLIVVVTLFVLAIVRLGRITRRS